MKDLTEANRVNELIAKKFDKVTPVSLDDIELFQEFFDNEEASYGNSWPYVTLGGYKVGPYNLGYKYYDGKNISVVYAYPHITEPEELVFYWVNPLGDTISEKVSEVSRKILKQFGIKVTASKLKHTLYNKLINFGFVDTATSLPWHSQIPLEDDTFPEIINDIEATLENKNGRNGIKKALKSYSKLEPLIKLRNVKTKQDKDLAFDLVDRFFEQDLKSLELNISDSSDYYNLIFQCDLNNHFLYLLEFDDKPVGLFDYYIHNKDLASAYCSLMLREQVKNIDDYTTILTMKKLASEGVSFLNVGGSETTGLDYYKRKFEVHKTRKFFWASLIN